MSVNTLRTFPALAILLALTLPATAAECQVSTTIPDATVDLSAAGAGTYYVDDTCTLLGFVTNHALGCGDGFPWVYEESNGLAGLQRGDEVVDDTCGGRIASDTIVF